MKKIFLLFLMTMVLTVSSANAFVFYSRNGLTSSRLESKRITKTSKEYDKCRVRTRRLLRNAQSYVRSRMKLYEDGLTLTQTMAEKARTESTLPKLSKMSLPTPEHSKKESILLPKVNPKKQVSI